MAPMSSMVSHIAPHIAMKRLNVKETGAASTKPIHSVGKTFTVQKYLYISKNSLQLT